MISFITVGKIQTLRYTMSSCGKIGDIYGLYFTYQDRWMSFSNITLTHIKWIILALFGPIGIKNNKEG